MAVTPEKKIANLREELNHHILRYHQEDDPEISDEEYDSLYAELEKLEAEHPN
ncbi:MAG: hypothetical protein IPK93_06440 [Solirubrobacterales bacterium]|nr:hypothetical protein [Solirubrobacterales bacterium]